MGRRPLPLWCRRPLPLWCRLALLLWCRLPLPVSGVGGPYLCVLGRPLPLWCRRPLPLWCRRPLPLWCRRPLPFARCCWLLACLPKVSASRAEDPWFKSRLRRDFSGSSHTSDLKIGTPVATLPGAWRYRASAGTGWPGVSIM